MAAEEASFRYVFPPELTGGAYANVLSVWHTAHEFTLDFFATNPARPEDPDDEESALVVQCRLVSRIRLPVTLVFTVIRILNTSMTSYEDRYGEIRRPTEDA